MSAKSLPPKSAAFALSGSGGKDSILACWRAIQAGAKPAALVNMMIESGQRSRSHGLAREVIEAQAQALGLDAYLRATSWNGYEANLVAVMGELKAQGINHMVFGDIDLEDHRIWEERVCAQAGMSPHLPLYEGGRRALVEELIEAGFKALVVAVKADCLGPEFLGRVVDQEWIQQMETLGLDACGEEGEYHTVVFDGPCFKFPLNLRQKEAHRMDGVWFLDLELA